MRERGGGGRDGWDGGVEKRGMGGREKERRVGRGGGREEEVISVLCRRHRHPQGPAWQEPG